MLLHAEYCTKQFDCLICHWRCVNCAVLLFGFPRSSLPPLLRSIVVIDQSIANLLHIQPFSQPIPFIPLPSSFFVSFAAFSIVHFSASRSPPQSILSIISYLFTEISQPSVCASASVYFSFSVSISLYLYSLPSPTLLCSFIPFSSLLLTSQWSVDSSVLHR